ncbi:MAG: FMN-binding negative transcriptional regulator [Proteobacteria bacterium]|nr:FMN-binding negative transcriptional regulator [Pseudomonadota bacterium]
MHPNPIYRGTERQTNLDFAAKRGFGVLSINGEAGPLISHVPFVMTEDGRRIEAHLMRSNPIARALAGGKRPAILAISGADSYVSPDWYEMEDQVPTWNYVAVHIRGDLKLKHDADLRPHLDRLSANFEARLMPKAPWLTDKVDPDALAKLLRMIVPIELEIGTVDGTWKLAQNKPEAARLAAADAMATAGIGSETADLAKLMRAPPEKID